MADFCRQCSIDTFGEDTRDLAGITKPEDWAKSMAVGVICEGCGPIQVDPEGNCVSPCALDPQPGHNGVRPKAKTKRKTGMSKAMASPYGGATQPWAVVALNCDGSKPDYYSMWFSAEEARKHADWLHQGRTVMNVEIKYPRYSGEKVAPTAQDVAIGHALAEVLDNRTVTPSAKMDINLWLDSKEWP